VTSLPKFAPRSACWRSRLPGNSSACGQAGGRDEKDCDEGRGAKARPEEGRGVRERSPGSFEIQHEGPRDRAGKRKALSVTFKCATLDEALRERRRLQADVDAGRHVDRSKLMVGDYVTQRIDRWVALDAITPKTAMRYRELAANQIAPFIGDFELQKLKTIDIEECHGALLASGRKGGGALSKMTVKHAHRLFSKALAEAVKHELVIKNVAAVQQPRKVEREEVVILTREQIRAVMEGLKHRVIFPKAVIALFTGMRRGELLALRRGAIDLDRRSSRSGRPSRRRTRSALRRLRARPARAPLRCPISSKRCARSFARNGKADSRLGSER
jgi:integrase